MNRLDITAWSLLLTLSIVLFGIYLRGSQIKLEVELSGASAANHFTVGPNGPIEFTFSRPVQEGLLAAKIHITPDSPGKISWDDPEHAEFVPDQPFKKDIEYSLSLQRGILGKSGEKISSDQSWEFELRSPMIIYIASSPTGNELWTRSTSEKSKPIQLTHTNGKIFDYSPAPNGAKVIYAAANDQKGIDLWIIDRDGKNNHVILNCGHDYCSAGSWSPDSRKIAFNRQSAGLAPGSSMGAPRPWILDVKTGETKPIYSDSQTIGYGPIWSPDGQKIATYDGVKGQIQIYNIKQNGNIFVPSQSGTSGTFSPDGQKLYFTDLVQSATGVQTKVFVYDIATEQTQPVANVPNPGSNAAYDLPQWSPNGDWMAVGVQSSPDNPVSQIWLVPANGSQPQQITNDPHITNLFYSWDELGDGLLFQRNNLGSGKSSSETDIWWSGTQQLQVISDNASMAHWLP
jgi:dipeptidyl aminopeptidase/acylaminoacyl peptidase